MARETYELSNETRRVLTDHVKPVADEMEKSPQYLHAILSGVETDIFAKFVPLYAAAVRANAPVFHWRNKLNAIDARYKKDAPASSEIECLVQKISDNADTTTAIVDALKDGVICEREAIKIQAAIEKEKRNLEILESVLNFKRQI